jgi:hypothetical protein
MLASNNAKVKKLLRELAFPADLLAIDLKRLELGGKDMPSHDFESLIDTMQKAVNRLEELIKNAKVEVK